MERNLLFDLAKVTKRKTPSQKEFEKENSDLLLAFPNIVKSAFVRLNKEIYPIIEPESRDKNMAATLISGFLRGELKANFPLYCEGTEGIRFRMVGKKREWIYVKKLTVKKRPMNIETENHKDIINQNSKSKTDVGGNVFLGYTANTEMTQETDTFAVCIEGKNILWVSDLAYLQKQHKGAAIRTETKEPQLKDGIIKLKKNKSA